jgi:hypothetical protein
MAAFAAAAVHAGQGNPQPQQAPVKPDCTVSDVRPTATPPASKLPVDTRRSIFVALQQAVARARDDAAKAYPTAEGGALMSPTNVQKDTKLARKRDTAALSLERTYVADVLKQRAMTCAAAREIVREGQAAGWTTGKGSFNF